MKRRFKIEVRAKDGNEAFEMARAPGKTKYKRVTDTPETVMMMVRGKLRRVETNPRLYADKIAEYGAILKRAELNAQSGMDEAEVVAELMLDHGDSRLDNPDYCGVIEHSAHNGGWFVFGFDFTSN